MAKTKSVYVCGDCGSEHPQWQGQCASCSEWNTLTRFTPAAGNTSSGANQARSISVSLNTATRNGGYAGSDTEVKHLSEVEIASNPRISSGFEEFDRVLGGGFVPGSVVLMGGEPGAGKSTLLLQVTARLASQVGVLYVSGEESLQQLAMRATRLKLPTDSLRVAAETRAEEIAALMLEHKPGVLVLDSIQVMQLDSVESVPGSVSQVRETAAFFTRLAKQSNTVVILVGHVTKEGSLAGPKVLEHMIDCFVMLDSPVGSRYRTLRGLKNRFGAVNELGVFAMTDLGMREVSNPSAIFLQRSDKPAAGSVTTVLWEGTRPLLIELQALVDDVQGGYPKRLAIGLDAQRLGMHLAVLHRHCGVSLNDQDVFANVVGGVRVGEPGVDLALLLAVLSSYKNRVIPADMVVFGELGLTGEVRPVANGQERLREAYKHGFRRAIIPEGNKPRPPIEGMEIVTVSALSKALAVFDEA
ncbi:MAG: DNA repair protein RadA [Pseudomonadales bacterium]|nr:DNA repair protein RadA [Pseudomonadales bacterium]